MIKNYICDVDRNEIYEDENINKGDFIEPTFYDCFDFHNYHKRFTSEVFCLGIKSEAKVIGYCYFGLKNKELKAPYSSPFSLIHLKENFKISDACIFAEGIKKIVKIKDIDRVHFTLPPEIYENELTNTLSTAFFSKGFKIKSIELNNYFDLSEYMDIETYLKKSPHKVRKNYKKALNNNLKFEQIDIENFEEAYNVIKINREQMGYPLKISKQQMQDLINMENLTVRAFVVKNQEKSIAAALIFDVTPEVSQVVYWGDNLEYRAERAMDLLTAEIFDVYKKLEKKYLDIGPSSEDGVINIGLADFKKSIGCNTNTKLVFEYEVK